MTRGRPPLPPEQRKKRRSGKSGKHRVLVDAELTAQRARISALAARAGLQVGVEGWIAALARACGVGPSTVGTAWRGRAVRPETLDQWGTRVRAYLDVRAKDAVELAEAAKL